MWGARITRDTHSGDEDASIPTIESLYGSDRTIERSLAGFDPSDAGSPRECDLTNVRYGVLYNVSRRGFLCP